jgi:uncharacterized protein YxeA
MCVLEELKLLTFWVVDMSKIKKEIIIFIVFVMLVVIGGLLIKLPSNTTYPPEPQIDGFTVLLKNGTTEPEVKAILENNDMILNYSIDSNQDNGEYKYYLEIYKDNMPDAVADGLKKDWIDTELYVFVKGDYYIYPITKQAIKDQNFLAILKRHNLQVKRFVWSLVKYENQTSHYIQEHEARIIKRKLEMNEKVLYVIPKDIFYGSVAKKL